MADALAVPGSASAAVRSRGGVTFSVEAPCQEEPRRLLDACFLCGRSLGGSSDVFIGDTPFCSEECRQEQIALDEAGEEKKGIRWSRRESRGVQTVLSHAAETTVA
ncbi:unnamed protein product [Spirodela intermedia]|uniref:FLZ-type domain-containing protein n=1 Tax=Spirodela intermedia TaxID=51605 RepID=A0A7I8JHW4_SPIIN|nr:unnamed protein product [Spirodela intermedia]CAA6669744.1 unnamed protein product [Spirodela intermedia]